MPCTLRLLLTAGICLVLATGARASDADAAATGPAPASAAQTSAPEEGCNAPSKDCVAVGQWNFNVSLGAGVRTDPVVYEATIPLVVTPQFSYYGRRFFIEDLDVGFTLADSAANTLSLIASPGYDRVFFYRSDLQNIFVSGFPATETASQPQVGPFPARPRNWTYLAGPEWTFRSHGITGQLDLLHEITGRNHGDEARAALAASLIESTGTLSANVGLTWKSAAIVNYYYGAPGVYEGGAALDPFVKLAYSRPLGGRWRLTAFVHYEHLGNAITESPIVNARSVVTVFAGANYAF